MDFRKQMYIREQNKDLEFRLYHPVTCGNFKISIQASRNHYCSPRQWLDDITEYEKFEIAIFNENDEWVNIQNDNRFMEFDEIEGILDNYDGMVGAYINKDLIQRFCDFVQNL